MSSRDPILMDDKSCTSVALVVGDNSGLSIDLCNDSLGMASGWTWTINSVMPGYHYYPQPCFIEKINFVTWNCCASSSKSFALVWPFNFHLTSVIKCSICSVWDLLGLLGKELNVLLTQAEPSARCMLKHNGHLERQILRVLTRYVEESVDQGNISLKVFFIQI